MTININNAYSAATNGLHTWCVDSMPWWQRVAFEAAQRPAWLNWLVLFCFIRLVLELAAVAARAARMVQS